MPAAAARPLAAATEDGDHGSRSRPSTRDTGPGAAPGPYRPHAGQGPRFFSMAKRLARGSGRRSSASPPVSSARSSAPRPTSSGSSRSSPSSGSARRSRSRSTTDRSPSAPSAPSPAQRLFGPRQRCTRDDDVRGRLERQAVPAAPHAVQHRRALARDARSLRRLRGRLRRPRRRARRVGADSRPVPSTSPSTPGLLSLAPRWRATSAGGGWHERFPGCCRTVVYGFVGGSSRSPTTRRALRSPSSPSRSSSCARRRRPTSGIRARAPRSSARRPRRSRTRTCRSRRRTGCFASARRRRWSPCRPRWTPATLTRPDTPVASRSSPSRSDGSSGSRRPSSTCSGTRRSSTTSASSRCPTRSS